MFSFLAALAVTLVGSVVSLFAASKQQKEQYELNSQLMDKQAGLNREQYDYEYAKESPAARVRQYMEAGLNPALMYSNGVAGMQGSVSGVGGSSVGIPYLSDLFDLSENMMNLSSSREKEGKTEPSKVKMDELKSVIALNDANKTIAEAMPDRIKAETDATRFDTHLKKALESTTIDTAKINLDIASESYRALQEQVKQLKEQNKVLPDRLKNDLAVQEQALALGKIDLYLKQTYGEKEAQSRIRVADAMIEHFYSEIDVNKERAPQLKELARKYAEDADYRATVNAKLKQYGLDVSSGGLAGMTERIVARFGDIVHEIMSLF